MIPPDKTTRYPKTVALMEEMGIDVLRVAENEFDTTGYWELALDENGNRILGKDGGIAATRRQWPSPADALRVVDQFVQERLAQK